MSRHHNVDRYVFFVCVLNALDALFQIDSQQCRCILAKNRFVVDFRRICRIFINSELMLYLQEPGKQS